jgi:hypothetical protein
MSKCGLITITLALSVIMLSFQVALAEESDDCDVPNQTGVEFLPKTTAPLNLMPPLEPGQPIPRDCEFYRWAWQTFLFVTQPQADQRPAFLKFKSFQDVFKI